MADHAKARHGADAGVDLSGPEGGPASIEAGRLLFAQPCTFLRGAAALAHLPDGDLPEVAFAGRSNVGKSSLLNALTGRRALARTSNTPGRTQEINFFDLGGGRLRLADLPGYGFAEAPKPKVEAWTRLVRAYLRGRPSLRRVLLLIDARHGPKPSDGQIMAMLDDAAVSYQLVLTKADKPGAAALDECLARTAALARRHVAAHPETLVTSSQTGAGIAELRAALAEVALPAGG
jgi:GTP-binding protein